MLKEPIRLTLIAGDRRALDLGGEGFGELGIDVAHRDPGARRRQFSRGGGPEARRAAGDDRGLILQLHLVPP
jgi:hypothetical protein